MTTLTLRRDYLQAHRRLAVARALATTAASLVPVPFLDDWLREAVLGGAYKRIAATYQIDLDPTAVKNLVHGRSQPASWVDLTSSALALRLASQSIKRVMMAITAMRRAQAASRTFASLTLFDHYCARLHTGLGLDGPRALAIADLASGGRLRKLLDRGKDEVALAEAVDEVDALVDRELADRDGWFAKAVAAIELQLTADVNPFLDAAIDRFEATWRGKP